jgi:hypothetical protein
MGDKFTATTFQNQWFWGWLNVAGKFFVAENIDSWLIVKKDDHPQVESLMPLLELIESHIHQPFWEAPSPIDPGTILKMQHFLTGAAVRIALLGRFQLHEGLFQVLELILEILDLWLPA